MLRLNNIKKLGFTLKGPSFYPVFTPKRFFAAENEAPEEIPENPEPEVPEKGGEKFNVKDLSRSGPTESPAERGRMVNRVPLADSARLKYYKKDMEYRLRNKDFGPFDFFANFKEANDDVLANLQKQEIAHFDATKVSIIRRSYLIE